MKDNRALVRSLREEAALTGVRSRHGHQQHLLDQTPVVHQQRSAYGSTPERRRPHPGSGFIEQMTGASRRDRRAAVRQD